MPPPPASPWRSRSCTSLLVSPLIGFACAGLLLALTKHLLSRRPELFEPPHGQKPPPWWIRCVLVFTCTGVSFAHGSNDGQKGIGLIMLMLIGVLPGAYAVNLRYREPEITATVSSLDDLRGYFGKEVGRAAANGSDRDVAQGTPSDTIRPTALGLNSESAGLSLTPAHVEPTPSAILRQLEGVRADLDGKRSLADLPVGERWKLRLGLLQLRQAVLDYLKAHAPMIPASQRLALGQSEERLMQVTEYAPNWVPLGVALSLVRHHDRLEAHRRHGRGEHRQGAPRWLFPDSASQLMPSAAGNPATNSRSIRDIPRDALP